jgi:hypothetical protein
MRRALCRAPLRARIGLTVVSLHRDDPGGPAEIIVGERMVKEQQMRCTPRGARLLLQVRTHVLNDKLAGDFRRWYPGFNQVPDPAALTA